MDYKIEELIPIVSKLADKYTSKQSTSISYEKAQQFMQAVLYCLHEYEKITSNSIVTPGNHPVMELYKLGVKAVEDKVKNSLQLYNTIMNDFLSYGNLCLQDTMISGMPEFFKWYDSVLEPQNTILTLDYPVLADLSLESGIDKIHHYLVCIDIEQRFLKLFPSLFITNALSQYNKRYKHMIDNLCEIVLMNALVHILSGISLQKIQFEPEDYHLLGTVLLSQDKEMLNKKLSSTLKTLVHDYFENDDAMALYLDLALDNIVIRLLNAAQNHTLTHII